MILRRIASALRRQDWAAVMIELTLVVTGVLIALAASDLYTQRIERRSELIMLDLMRPVYLERFVDLRFNESATPLDYASLVGDIRFINLIDYRLAVIRQGEMQILSGARAHMLELIDLIDAELGGKAEAVAGGAEA